MHGKVLLGLQNSDGATPTNPHPVINTSTIAYLPKCRIPQALKTSNGCISQGHISKINTGKCLETDKAGPVVFGADLGGCIASKT